MRVFAIRDESLSGKVLGYLIYYINPKAFYIELIPGIDEWEAPLILSAFVKRGEYSIGSYWSCIWVQQRIIPQDRQNIGQILRDNGLSSYDELELLLLSMGRCAQDDCYLEELSDDMFPEELLSRWQYKLEDVVPTDNYRLLAFFRTGEVKMVDMKELVQNVPSCEPFLQTEERFNSVELQPDGYGIMWNEHAAISDLMLYRSGTSLHLSLDDFCRFVQYRVVNSAEAAAILDCSRQNINDLIRRDKLHPVRNDARNKLFLRNEVIQRKKGHLW